MNNKESLFSEESDHYEEILVYESLDQYEGLLNHTNKKKKLMYRYYKGTRVND